MRPSILRRVLVVLGGIVVFLIGGIATWIGGLFLAAIPFRLTPANAVPEVSKTPPISTGHSLPASSWLSENMNPHIDMLWAVAFLSASAALGLAFILIFWAPVMTNRRRTAIRFVPLLVVAPISAINFAYGDRLMSVWIQFFLDLLLVFFGATAILYMLGQKFETHEERVGQSMLLFLLTLAFVLIPGTYALTFLLWKAGMSPPNLGAGWTGSIQAVVSAVVATLAHLKRLKASDNSDRPRIIVPPGV